MLLFSSYLGDYRSVELICITVTVSLFFVQNAVTEDHLPQDIHPQQLQIRSLKNYQSSTEEQKRHQHLAPVLVIIAGISLVFSRNIFASTGFFSGAVPRRSARVSPLNHKRFFSGILGELIFLWRVELFWICNGFDHSVAFFWQAFHSMWARRRGANWKCCYSAHPNPDSTTSQTQLWDRDLLFTRILFIVQIESGHPENIAFNGRGSCPQTCPETVAQKRRPKHHNGRKRPR